MAEASDKPCVSKETFYKPSDSLKSKQVKKESKITLFIEDAFFDEAKVYLKYCWFAPHLMASNVGDVRF